MPKLIKNKKALKRLSLQGKIKGYNCSICFEDAKECSRRRKNCTCLTTLHDSNGNKVCEHSFCFKCIYKWSEQNNTCPLCRKHFNQLICKKRAIQVKTKSIRDNVLRVLEENMSLRMRFVMDYCDNNPCAIEFWRLILRSFERMKRSLSANEKMDDIVPNVSTMVRLIRMLNP